MQGDVFHSVVRRLPDSIAWKIRNCCFHGVENHTQFFPWRGNFFSTVWKTAGRGRGQGTGGQSRKTGNPGKQEKEAIRGQGGARSEVGGPRSGGTGDRGQSEQENRKPRKTGPGRERRGANLRFGARPSPIERRRVVPELGSFVPPSRDLGPIPTAGLRAPSEIPRPAFAQGSGEAGRLGMTAGQRIAFVARGSCRVRL